MESKLGAPARARSEVSEMLVLAFSCQADKKAVAHHVSNYLAKKRRDEAARHKV